MSGIHGKVMIALVSVAVMGLGASAPAQTSGSSEQEKVAAAATSEKPAETAKADKSGDTKEKPVPSNRRLNTYGVLPSSALNDGGMDIPVEMRVPEQYQYRRPDLQLTEGMLSGKQLPPVLTEFRVLTKKVKPGDEVRVLAKVVSPYNEAAQFTSLFYNQDLGRAAELYVNFKPDKKDKTLFRGLGKVTKYAAPGRYVVGTTIIPDAVGDRKAYWADFHKVMQEEDGSPAGFDVTENPNADVEAPTLKSVEVETKSVKAGEGMIYYTVVTEDDRSGPIEAEGVWVSPTGYQSIRNTMVMRGDKLGTFKGAFRIPEWYEGGGWKLQQIAIKDDATNVRFYFDVAEPMMKGKVVQVLQDPKRVDKTPPKVLAVQLSHREATPDDTVTITALVEDNLSGVEAVQGYFVSEHGADAIRLQLKMSNVDLNRPSKIPEPTVWSGTIKVKETMEMGTWRVVRLGVSDQARNYYTYFENREDVLTGITCKFIGPEKAEAEKTEGKQ